MNIKVDGRSGVQSIMAIFTACCIIHNVLLESKDSIPKEWYDEIEKDHEWTHDSDDVVEEIPEDEDRRKAVFNAIIEDYYV